MASTTATATKRRTKRSDKGIWMKLTSPATLKALMEQRQFTGARLARYAECHRSFITYLLNGKKTTCSRELATKIAEALDVPVAILFVQHASADRGRSTNAQRKAA